MKSNLPSVMLAMVERIGPLRSLITAQAQWLTLEVEC